MQTPPQNGWFVSRGGQQYGPYDWDQLVRHAGAGRIARSDRIFDPRTGAWAKPSQVSGLFGRGGAAAKPAGLSTAAKIAAGAVLATALLMVGATTVWIASSTPGFVREYGTVEGMMQAATRDDAPKSATAEVPPEGLVFKGTFDSVTAEGVGAKDLSHSDQAYLWIYTTDEGTAASLDYGEYYVDGWPVYLVSNSGSRFVFESSDRSLVERVRIEVDVSGDSATARVTTIDRIGSFRRGAFRGTSAPYEQYHDDVIE
jgi:hypothetical protein